MKRLLGFVLSLTAATAVFSQSVVTRTERVVTQTEPATVTKVETIAPAYTTRLVKAYEYAGIPAEKVTVLRDYDTKIIEARRVGDTAKVTTYVTEQRRVLAPEQVEKVKVYLSRNPLTGVTDKVYLSTWETPVEVEEVGVIKSEPAVTTVKKTVVAPETVKVTVPSEPVRTEEVEVQTVTRTEVK